MLKFITIVLIVSAGSLSGYFKALKLSERVKFWDDFIRFISYIKTSIKYNCDDLIHIIVCYKKTDKLSFLESINEDNLVNCDFLTLWDSCISKIPKSYGLTKDDYDLLGKFSLGLGVTDVEGQITHCQLYETFFLQQKQEAAVNQNKRSKLYRLLGVFSGICIALIIA
ncbi:MAG: stage III sporulation protein AB [Clostridia bacterium]|nr:stage III sporulation protein AB [Clostridia bacterium]